MSLYISVFLVLFLLSIIEIFGVFSTYKKKYIVFLLSIFYVFLSGIYAGPAGDYESYEQLFHTVSNFHVYSDTRYEIIYRTLNIIMTNLTSSYVAFRVLLASIVMVLWYKICTYDKDALVSKYTITIMWIVWCLNFGNIFVIRSTVAVTICVYSLRFLDQKKFWKYFLCAVMAMGFHNMSIVWFMAYFVYNYGNLRKLYYFFIFGGLIIRDKLVDVVLYFAEHIGGNIYTSIYGYLHSGHDPVSNYSNLFNVIKGAMNIVLLLIVFIYIIIRMKALNRLTNEINYYNMYLMGTVLYVFAMCTSMEFARASQPYNAVQYLLLPRLFELPEVNRSRKTKYIVFIFFTLYLLMRLYMNMNSNNYLPFNTIF